MASSSETAQVTAGKYLSLPERFEKSRLAILSFSALSILFSMASGDTTREPSAYGISLDALSLASLTWMVACFYVWPFVSYDYPALRSAHTRIADSDHRTSFDTVARRMTQRVETIDAALAGAISEATHDFARQVYDRSPDPLMIDHQARRQARERLLQILAKPDGTGVFLESEQIIDEISGLMEESKHAYAEERAKLHAVLLGNEKTGIEDGDWKVPSSYFAVLEDVQEQIFGLRDDFNLLSERLDGREIARLVWWEGRAPLVVHAIASIYLLGAYAAAVGRFTFPGPRQWLGWVI